MTEPSTARPIILRRVQMSTTAWTLLCESTSATLGLPAEPVAGAEPLTEAATAAGWAELHTLEMSPLPGEVTRQWTGAVALLLTAPITVTARGTYNGVSTTSALGLRAGRGLAVHQRHVSEQGSAGTTITGSEDSMEITLFNEENVWGAVSRLLPPLDVVRARAQAAPMNSDPAIILGVGSDPASLPAEDANIALSVTTTAPGLPPRVWAGMWSVQGETLYSVTTRNTASSPETSSEAPELRLTEVPAGHIAHELVFAVVGAHDALAAAAAAAPAATEDGSQ
ncbi:hypothetical protein NHF46_02210 [Arthrobacter alpinus]|nr:hypothetical protein [Arthrobacter alpinus]